MGISITTEDLLKTSALSLSFFSLAACSGGGGYDSPTSTPTPAPIASPSPAPSPSPTSSPTPAPSPTPTFTPTPSSVTTSVHPGPEIFRVGNAIAPINYYMTAWSLNDIFKQTGYEDDDSGPAPSRAWWPVSGGLFAPVEEFRMVQQDALGWPTTLELTDGSTPDELRAFIAGGSDLPDVLPAGDYEMTWDGTGSLDVIGAEVVTMTSNSMTLSYDGTQALFLQMSETDPQGTGDYIRNISILRPDAVDGETFNRTYVDFVEPFSVIRPLHYVGEQSVYGPAYDWSERKPVDYSHWGGTMGGPYEGAIELANVSNSDLWLNIPIAGSDDFFQNLADLTFNGLAPERKLYIELGNEVWNFAPPYTFGREQALAAARARWPDVFVGETRPWSGDEPVFETTLVGSWVGTRLAEACDIFKAQWGDQSDRVFCVIAGQVGASGEFYFPNRYLLETPVYVGEEGGLPAGQRVDAFAIAPYVGDVEGPTAFDRSSVEAFFADATAYVRGEGAWSQGVEEPGLRYYIREDAALAAEFDLPLVAYEGGHHFIGSLFTRDTVSNHPLMYDLYQTFFDVWKEEGGGLFVHYAGIIPPGRSEPGAEPSYFESENFGIISTQTQSLENSPKLRSVLDEMTEIGQRP